MPRYVILTHDHPFPHLDLMLDTGAVLRTWRLLGDPRAGGPVPAESLPEHRRAYLDYEGPISGGRGRVIRWDEGGYEVLEESATGLKLRFAGAALVGSAELVRVAGDRWEFRVRAHED